MSNDADLNTPKWWVNFRGDHRGQIADFRDQLLYKFALQVWDKYKKKIILNGFVDTDLHVVSWTSNPQSANWTREDQCQRTQVHEFLWPEAHHIETPPKGNESNVCSLVVPQDQEIHLKDHCISIHVYIQFEPEPPETR